MPNCKYQILPALFAIASAASAGSRSLLVLEPPGGDLLRVSLDGQTVGIVAPDAGGLDLAIDSRGNYLIATGSELVRVARDGEKTTLAKAPDGSSWVSVAAFPDGSVVLADEPAHLLWRVNPNGELTKLARYPGSLPLGDAQIGLAAQANGECLVMRLSDENAVELMRVGPDGAISAMPLRGAVHKPARISQVEPDVRSSISGGSLVSDGSGGYFFLDAPWTRNLFHLSSTGDVKRIAKLPEAAGHGRVLVRDPKTQEFIVGSPSGLRRIAADGVTTSVLAADDRLRKLRAIVLEEGE